MSEEVWEDAKAKAPFIDRDAVLAHLGREQEKGASLPVTIGPMAALQLIQVCQLVCRHPEAGEALTEVSRRFGQQLEKAFQGSHLEAEIAEGWQTT